MWIGLVALFAAAPALAAPHSDEAPMVVLPDLPDSTVVRGPSGEQWLIGRVQGTLELGEVRLSSSESHVFVARIDDRGSLVWARTYDDLRFHTVRSVSVESDGGVTLTGRSPGLSPEEPNVDVVRLAENGTLLWQHSMDVEEAERAYSMWAALAHEAAVEVPPSPSSEPPGELRIAVVGGGWAYVFVDGKKLERTAPLARLELPPGEHTVELLNEDLGLREIRTVNIASGVKTFVAASVR